MAVAALGEQHKAVFLRQVAGLRRTTAAAAAVPQASLRALALLSMVATVFRASCLWPTFSQYVPPFVPNVALQLTQR